MNVLRESLTKIRQAAWKNIGGKGQSRKHKGRSSNYTSRPINDNYCVSVTKAGQLARSRQTVSCFSYPEAPRKTLDIQTLQTQVVNFSVVKVPLL